MDRSKQRKTDFRKNEVELLALYEKTADMHIVLEYRGDMQTAQKYLDAQDKVFGGE